MQIAFALDFLSANAVRLVPMKLGKPNPTTSSSESAPYLSAFASGLSPCVLRSLRMSRMLLPTAIGSMSVIALMISKFIGKAFNQTP